VNERSGGLHAVLAHQLDLAVVIRRRVARFEVHDTAARGSNLAVPVPDDDAAGVLLASA
jgi:hypothetical protein